MLSLYERIELLCKEKNITVTELSRQTRISRASFSDLKMGRKNSFSSKTLQAIADYFGVTVDYLLGKTDNPYGGFGALDPVLPSNMQGVNLDGAKVDERQLREIITNLSFLNMRSPIYGRTRKAVLSIAQSSGLMELAERLIGEAERNIKEKDLGKSIKGVRVPVLGHVAAGVPIEAIEDEVDWEDIPTEWIHSGHEYFGLKVQGDSMYPKYLEGDTVIVRKTEDCESGQDCVVYVNGYDATLKNVKKQEDGSLILVPFNREYPPKKYTPKEIDERPVVICGVVVELRRKV